jgi:hypothetical protein
MSSLQVRFVNKVIATVSFPPGTLPAWLHDPNCSSSCSDFEYQEIALEFDSGECFDVQSVEAVNVDLATATPDWWIEYIGGAYHIVPQNYIEVLKGEHLQTSDTPL